MKPMTFSELKGEASDTFSFILLGCPNWSPLLPNLTTRKVFEDLIDLLDAITERTRNELTKQWLRVCLLEVRQCWKSYEDGDIIKGKELIQQAEEYFKNAFSKKPIEPRFIVDKTGPAIDSERAFLC